jgi:hypothetical protein
MSIPRVSASHPSPASRLPLPVSRLSPVSLIPLPPSLIPSFPHSRASVAEPELVWPLRATVVGRAQSASTRIPQARPQTVVATRDSGLPQHGEHRRLLAEGARPRRDDLVSPTLRDSRPRTVTTYWTGDGRRETGKMRKPLGRLISCREASRGFSVSRLPCRVSVSRFPRPKQPPQSRNVQSAPSPNATKTSRWRRARGSRSRTRAGPGARRCP